MTWNDYSIYGYAFVPPTPFMLKDWERYDVSRYLDPLCVAPEEGRLSVSVAKNVLKHQTIQEDLQASKDEDLSRAIFLFHTPPYKPDWIAPRWTVRRSTMWILTSTWAALPFAVS